MFILTKRNIPALMLLILCLQRISYAHLNYQDNMIKYQKSNSNSLNFIEIKTDLPDVNYSSVSWGDYDSDSDLDIVISGKDKQSNYITKVFKNNSGQFTEISSQFIGLVRSTVDWGDYDNDGDLDILITGEKNNNKKITLLYQNNGNDDFSQVAVNLPGIDYYGFIKWSDFDHDGDLDIIISGSFGSTSKTKIYRNEGANIFGFYNSLPSHAYKSLIWEDFNNDGFLDLYIVGSASQIDPNQKSNIYQNNGNGIFTIVSSNLPSYYDPMVVSWADFDSDGDFDFVVDGWLCALNQNLSFKIINNNFPHIDGASSIVGDLNNDGKIDNLISGLPWDTNNSLTFILNYEGGNNFVRKATNLPGIRDGALAFGDYDNDNISEILLCGYQQESSLEITKLFKPEGISSNTLPEPPQNLKAEVIENAVILTWNDGYDSETPSKALTYNIRAGTAPGKFDIVSPMADIVTGKRFIAAYGNAYQSTRYKLCNLKNGAYYWSVQTIDNAFAASRFSQETNFTITNVNHQPTIISKPDTISLIDSLYEYQIIGSDPDNDPLTYSISTDIFSFNIDPQSGLVSGKPDYSEIGIHQVVITASDYKGDKYQQSFNLHVIDPNALPPDLPDPIISLGIGNKYFYHESVSWHGGGHRESDFTEEIIGDTMIQNRSYAIVLSTDKNNYILSNLNKKDVPFLYFKRADSTKIYFYDQKSGEDFVLVDFSFPIGYEDPIFGYVFQKGYEIILNTSQFMIWANKYPFRKKYASTFGLISVYYSSSGSRGGADLMGCIIDGKVYGDTSKSNTGVSSLSEHISDDLILVSNYPNPFNLTTTIKYKLPKSTHVTLNIYNLAGQKIATLINDFQPGGEHNIKWQPDGLASGIYFYSLEAGEFSVARKLILQK